MHQFRDKSVQQREMVALRAALLPRADGRRRARLPRPRGAGGGGPARAPRGHARRRADVQRALRRDAGRARGAHPAGRRARARPAGADAQDVHDGRHRAGHRLRARRARRRSRKKFKRAQTDSGREIVRAAGQARRHQPDRDPGRRRAAATRRRSSASSRAAATATSRRRSATRWPTGWRRCASATTSCAPTRRALEELLAEGAERARAIAAPVVADVRDAMGVGPARRSVGPAA